MKPFMTLNKKTLSLWSEFIICFITLETNLSVHNVKELLILLLYTFFHNSPSSFYVGIHTKIGENKKVISQRILRHQLCIKLCIMRKIILDFRNLMDDLVCDIPIRTIRYTCISCITHE